MKLSKTFSTRFGWNHPESSTNPPKNAYNQVEYTQWKAKEFEFHTGEVLAELSVGYTTIGNPMGIPVLGR